MAGRVALVTGSTCGIGFSIARALASKGCSILLTGFGTDTVINQRRDEIQNDFNVPVSYFGADLSKTDEVDSLCRDIRSAYPGGVDILVNNAGFQFTSPVPDFPLEMWTSMMTVMMTAPFMLTKHFLPDMRKKGWGRIVNISSVHGHVASTNKAAYVTAKHGIMGFTKVVALEEARTGVTCNAVCPGWVDTEIFHQQVDAITSRQGVSIQEAKEHLLEKQPSKKVTSEKAVGEAVTFLCSPTCDNMTGSSLFLDGGWTAV